jgi:hypothetical protein
VEIFLGYVPDGGSLRDENDQIKESAIGLLVTNASVGIVKLSTTTSTGGSLHAVYAFGEASLIGLDGLTIEGTITVRINNTGQAINRLIELPDDPIAEFPPESDGVDNNGNGLTDEPGETAAIRVQFGEGKVEEFSAGFDEQGNISDDSAVTISAAGIFTLSGAVRFTRSPTGRVDVDLPEASVTISIPDGNNGLQEAFGLTGAAKFFFGGEEGFQLESLQVRGYSIFGQGATIPPAASTLIPPTADLRTWPIHSRAQSRTSSRYSRSTAQSTSQSCSTMSTGWGSITALLQIRGQNSLSQPRMLLISLSRSASITRL